MGYVCFERVASSIWLWTSDKDPQLGEAEGMADKIRSERPRHRTAVKERV
jgi:hypothetical protein